MYIAIISNSLLLALMNADYQIATNLSVTCDSFLRGDAETNNVPVRSSDLFFDGGITNINRNLVPSESRNQYDITAAGFQDGSLKHELSNNKHVTIGDTETVPLIINRYKEVSSNAHEGFTEPLLSKRFNEFVGKRGIPGEGNSFSLDDTLPGDDLSTVGILISSPESYQAEHGNKISTQTSIEGIINTDKLMHHLYNELRNDQRLKRQYEFVGKRNYDFVGKRNYDFVGKRSSYNFIGKPQPFHFLVSDDFLVKRAPYEFVGKRNPITDGSIDGLGTIPSWQTDKLPNMFYGLPDFYLNAPAFVDTSKRYSEFLGKRKRSIEEDDAGLSTTERLAALLQNNGLRKRLSRLLLNQRSAEHYPGFVGK